MKLWPVHFELQESGPNSSSSLMMGIRVFGKDRADAERITDIIVRGELKAEVKLVRLDSVGEHEVLLERVNGVGYGPVETVLVPSDGVVPGVAFSSPDSTALEEAGLGDPGDSSTTVAFASAFRTRPGNYRLTIRLLEPSPALADIKSELIVAYKRRAK